MPALQYTKLFLAVCLVCIVVLASAYKPVTSNARSMTGQQSERRLVNDVPRHIPIRIKIKKEKEEEFKNFNTPDWGRAFELEVTNTGTKPIYFLDLFTVFDVPNSAGQELNATLIYGRTEMGDPHAEPSTEDVPIKPGESAVLMVHPATLHAWDIKGLEERWRVPTQVHVKFQFLSFGDHTGYVGLGGQEYPRRESSGLKRDRKPGAGPPQIRTQIQQALVARIFLELRRRVNWELYATTSGFGTDC